MHSPNLAVAIKVLEAQIQGCPTCTPIQQTISILRASGNGTPLGNGTPPQNLTQHILAILKESDQALTAKAIMPRLDERGYVSHAKDPVFSVHSVLRRNASFKKVGIGWIVINEDAK